MDEFGWEGFRALAVRAFVVLDGAVVVLGVSNRLGSRQGVTVLVRAA